MKYLKTLENVDICAAADVSEMSLKRLKEEYPDVRQFTDYKQTGKELPSLHSSKFAPLPEPTIRTGIVAMTTAVLELMKK